MKLFTSVALTEFYVKYFGQTSEEHSLNRVTWND